MSTQNAVQTIRNMLNTEINKIYFRTEINLQKVTPELVNTRILLAKTEKEFLEIANQIIGQFTGVEKLEMLYALFTHAEQVKQVNDIVESHN